MKKPKGLLPFIIAVSLILVASSTYFHYYVLIEADFLYQGLKFECSDLDDLYVDKQNICDLNPTSLRAFSFFDQTLPSELRSFSSILSHWEPFPPILRC
jgi:hypothetical protein